MTTDFQILLLGPGNMMGAMLRENLSDVGTMAEIFSDSDYGLVGSTTYWFICLVLRGMVMVFSIS